MNAEDRVGVFVPLWAMDACDGDPRDAMVLAQITWWLQPTQRDGTPRTSHLAEYAGETWLYMTDAELGDETGMSADQVYRARNSLKRRGVLASASTKVHRRKVTLVRPTVDSARSRPSHREVAESDSARSRNPPSIENHVEEEPKPSSSDAFGADVERLCSLLADLVEGNGSKRPAITKAWRVACDRLIRLDGRAPDQVERAIRWCQADEFWRANVLSMPTLRRQYDRLRLAAQRERSNGNGGGVRRHTVESLAEEVAADVARAWARSGYPLDVDPAEARANGHARPLPLGAWEPTP